MGGPTGSVRYRQNSSWVHVTAQAPPLLQSRDTFGGDTILYTILIIFISIKIYEASHYAIFPIFLGFICFSQHSALTHPHSTSSFDNGSQVAHPYESKGRILDLEANIFQTINLKMRQIN
jgi:hypothetical protein